MLNFKLLSAGPRLGVIPNGFQPRGISRAVLKIVLDAREMLRR
jgi:hypothetical protein